MNIKRLATGALALGMLGAGPAVAQQRDSGWYIGGGLGQTDVSIDNAGINAAFTALPGITSAVTTSDDSDTGYKFFGGYQLNRNFAVEVGYANLGTYATTTRTTPAATFTGEIKVENNWFADVVAIMPFGNGFSIFGRLGLLYSETKVNLTGVGPGGVAGIGTKEDDISWKAGLGIGYEFTNQFGIRGEWERYNVSEGAGSGKADIDLWSVSLRFKF